MVSCGEFARFSPREGISRNSAIDSKHVSGREKRCLNKGFYCSSVQTAVPVSGWGCPRAGHGEHHPGSPAAAQRSRAFIQQRPEQIPCLPLCLELSAERARLKGTQTPLRIGGAMGGDGRVNEISVIKEAGGGLGAWGSRRCPSAASSARRGCDSRSAPTPGHALCIFKAFLCEFLGFLPDA